MLASFTTYLIYLFLLLLPLPRCLATIHRFVGTGTKSLKRIVLQPMPMQLNCIFRSLFSSSSSFYFFVQYFVNFDQFVACHCGKWQSCCKVKSLPNARSVCDCSAISMNGDNEPRNRVPGLRVIGAPESVICKLPNFISGVLKCRKTH